MSQPTPVQMSCWVREITLLCNLYFSTESLCASCVILCWQMRPGTMLLDKLLGSFKSSRVYSADLIAIFYAVFRGGLSQLDIRVISLLIYVSTMALVNFLEVNNKSLSTSNLWHLHLFLTLRGGMLHWGKGLWHAPGKWISQKGSSEF